MDFSRIVRAGLVPVLASSLVAGALAARLAYPPTPTGTATDTYFGTQVADPYRWLEDDDSADVKAWSAAQTSLAKTFLESRPSYAFYTKRVAELSKTSTARFFLTIRGGRFIYLRQTPPQPQPQLIARDGIAGTERVLFDPATAPAAGGAEPAIESVFVSNDGSKVAFTTQEGGSENETMHVVDTDPAAGTVLTDSISHVGGGTSPTALVWDADTKGFLHTQFQQKPDGTYTSERILLYHHVIGTDAATDTYVFGKDQSTRSEYSLLGSLDGKVQAISVTDGDGVHASIYMRRSSTPSFALVADPSAAIGDSADPAAGFVGDELYAISQKRDARGEVVALGLEQPFASAKVVVPASTLVIQGVREVRGGFITRDVDGGDSAARFFGKDGSLIHKLPLPAVSVLTALAGDPAGGDVIVGYQNYTTPNRWLRYDAASNKLTPTGIAETAPGDYSKVIVRRVLVPSLDGKVKIPLEISYLPGIKPGTAPTMLTAYGAYGVISTPFFLGPLLAPLERGEVFAQAFIRGGGEYGAVWHDAAVRKTKTLSSDDLAACAEWLGKNGYGNAAHLGIVGGSAGGFLMGLALTRNPSIYRAVVGQVGIYDLLRVELTPNGAYNTPEFGTVKDPAQFAWMLTQSPYHNVHKGTAYPAVLFVTGENDPRVAPYMSRKMIARLQADSSSSNPLLLIQNAGAGHGMGSSFQQQVEMGTQIDTFFESQLK